MVPPADPGDSSVRARVLRHMRKLLGASALAGVALGACGSEEPPVVCDPLPPPEEEHVVPDDEEQDYDQQQDPDRPDDPPVVCDPLPAPDFDDD